MPSLWTAGQGLLRTKIRDRALRDGRNACRRVHRPTDISPEAQRSPLDNTSHNEGEARLCIARFFITTSLRRLKSYARLSDNP